MPEESATDAGIDGVEPPGQVWLAETDLKAGALRLPGVLMQNITTIAPAIAAFFFTPAIVGFAGAHAPLAYLIGFIAVLALGWCLVQLARHFPSAGGYFTYVSRTLGPRLGFLVAWIFTFYLPFSIGVLAAYFGNILEGEFQTNYGWTWFHWWMFVVIFVPLITYLGHLGITLSVKLLVALGSIEFLIVLSLGLFGLTHPGRGGFSFQPFNYGFNPGAIGTASGFALAIVFTVQGLTGWEAAAPLAEETENPRRNIPLATMISIVVIGLLLVLVIWGQIIGWGVDNLTSLPTSSELPALVLAHHLWGGLWWLALFAMTTSVLGACIAFQNVSSRMWFAMGRSGVLPKALGRVHPVRKTPTAALLVQLVISLILGLGFGLWLGPVKIFLLVAAYLAVTAIILVYCTANVGVVVYFWRERRSEFNWIFHLIFPIGTSALLLYSLVKSYQPFPAFPYSLTPFIMLGMVILGVIILTWLKLTGREDWLARAGQIAGERPETSEELSHRPTV